MRRERETLQERLDILDRGLELQPRLSKAWQEGGKEGLRQELQKVREEQVSQKQRASKDGIEDSIQDTSATMTVKASPLFDMAIIGSWIMERKGFVYPMWSKSMLADADIRVALGEYASGKEEECFQKVYKWSQAILIGAYQFKLRPQEFESWTINLLLELDEPTKEEVNPYLRQMYKLASEMQSHISARDDADWILTALTNTRLEGMSVISTRRILAADRRDEAISLLRQQKYADALVVLKQLLASGAMDWNLHYMIGQCYRFTDDLDSAIIYLRRAAELKSDDTSVLLALGIAFQLTNRFTEAVDTFRRAIEADPDYELAYNSLALTQKKQGELELALHNYDAGAKALSRRIIKSLQNDRSSKIFKHGDIEHTLWIEYAMYGALYLCSVSGIEVLASPSSEMALEEERTEKHGGLYWIDSLNSESKLVRLFLPNYFNTFAELLKQDRAFSNLIGNRGTVLGQLGRNEEANQHFEEAEYFLPNF